MPTFPEQTDTGLLSSQRWRNPPGVMWGVVACEEMATHRTCPLEGAAEVWLRAFRCVLPGAPGGPSESREAPRG